MIASQSSLAVPGAASACNATPGDVASSVTRFTLSLKPTVRQVALENENPLCWLAARTEQGQKVCEKGCGAATCSGTRHTCPFGLTMILGKHDDQSQTWSGRRFASVQDMHQTLDMLLEAGMDEEMILDHLPDHPIMSLEEAGQTIQPAQPAQAQPSAPAAAKPAPAKAAAPQTIDDYQVNVIEYLTQIHSLIATGSKPAVVCERFLRALSGMLPFEAMEIYLTQPGQSELVITACTQADASLSPSLTRLPEGSVGQQAFSQRQPSIEREGRIEVLKGEWSGPGTVAIPLPPINGQKLGVWIARRTETSGQCPLGNQPVQLMSLLGEMLSSRLQQLRQDEEHTTTAANVQPAVTRWSGPALLAALQPELARAARQGHAAALMHLQVNVPGPNMTLPLTELTRGLESSLRGYDRVALSADQPNAWFVILPQADEKTAQMIGERLLMVVEDVMDTRGGTEELGLKIGLGISLWGADASTASQMPQHARQAAEQAIGLAMEGRVIIFESESCNAALS